MYVDKIKIKIHFKQTLNKIQIVNNNTDGINRYFVYVCCLLISAMHSPLAFIFRLAHF